MGKENESKKQFIFKALKLLNKGKMKNTEWNTPEEKDEPAEEKQVCQKCGNDTFRVYIKIIIDDARLYCAKCGEPLV